MQETNVTLGILNIVCGVLFILVSLPLVFRKIPMNRYYGFRFSKAMASPDNWYAVNYYGARQLIRWALLLIVIGILYFTFPMESGHSQTAGALMAAGPILICPAVAALKTLFFARQL